MWAKNACISNSLLAHGCKKLKFSRWDVKLNILSRRHCCMLNIWFLLSARHPPCLLPGCCPDVARATWPKQPCRFLPFAHICGAWNQGSVCCWSVRAIKLFLENKSESDWNPDVVLATGIPGRLFKFCLWASEIKQWIVNLSHTRSHFRGVLLAIVVKINTQITFKLYEALCSLLIYLNTFGFLWFSVDVKKNIHVLY